MREVPGLVPGTFFLAEPPQIDIHSAAKTQLAFAVVDSGETELRAKLAPVMAALVAAIPIGEAAPFPIEMAGTRPAMTREAFISRKAA